VNLVWLPLDMGRVRGFFDIDRVCVVEFFGHAWWCDCQECEAEYIHLRHQDLDDAFNRASFYCPGVLDKQ
jgi:hypothetical protein